MAQQIKKKFIGADQIDGSKIKLLQGQSIRGINSLGQEVDLVKISSSDKIEVLGQEVALKSALDQEVLDRQSGDASTLASAQSYADQKVADLVNSAPAVLDTLKELSDALGGDANFATTVAGQIGSLDSRLDVLEAFGYDQMLYVSKNGLDTNSGKQHSPFLTITAAMNAISDASPSKRYAIKVAPGSYSEALAIKANVFIVGEGQKEAVRVTGAISMGASFTANSSFDNRSGFANLTLLSAANFDWNAVQSAAGKLYFSEVVFGSTVNMNGYNNAIAQAQFSKCIIFGALTISGINVGVFADNVCFGNITLNQHPNGGMATILTATGGYCSGTIRQTTTVNDFNRRCASFLRGFPSESLIIDGPSSYADVDLTSQSKQGAQQLNGGNLVALNPVIAHDLTTQMIVPRNTNSHNMGDWGKQWTWNFGYVHASTGTDLFLISYPSSYAPDSAGKSIGIYTDGAGLQENVNGGEIVIETAQTSGTGVRGKVQLNGRFIDVSSKQVKNLADATEANDAINKGQLDSAISAIPQVTFNKESKTVDATILSNEYIDLAFEAKANSIVIFVGRLAIIEGSDYSVSVVGGVSRITFLSPMLVPSPEALEVGDIIHITYAK